MTVEWLPRTPTSELPLDELFFRLQDAKGKGQLDSDEGKIIPWFMGAWKRDKLAEWQLEKMQRIVHEVRTGKRSHEPVIDYVDED